MEAFDNIPAELFNLLEKKGFEELSSNEKNEVLKTITEQEYKDFYQLISDFKMLDFEVNSPPMDFEKLMEEKGGEKSNIKVYYRMAAAFAILFFAGLTIWDFNFYNYVDVPNSSFADSSSFSGIDDSSIDPKWLEGRLEIIKQSTESSERNAGLSLKNEEYPEDLVLDFGSSIIPGGRLNQRF